MASRPLILVLVLLLVACRAPLARHAFEEPAMGTTFRVVLYAPDAARAEVAADAAFARVAELERIFSDYDDASEARRLAGQGAGERSASSELRELTALALELGHASGGAFDVTVGPLTRLWRRALRQGEAPDPARLAAARAACGLDLLRVDERAGTIAFGADGMRLDFGGIAKGYALDEVLATLAEHGVDAALVDAGGDIACSAAPPGEHGWRVAIVPPRESSADATAGDGEASATAMTMLLTHAAVATSGDLDRGGVVDGAPRSHLVDPRTGEALPARPRTASAIASRGAVADAVASAMLVLDGEAGVRFASALPGVEARLVELEHDALRVWATAGFPSLVSSLPGDSVASSPLSPETVPAP